DLVARVGVEPIDDGGESGAVLFGGRVASHVGFALVPEHGADLHVGAEGVESGFEAPVVRTGTGQPFGRRGSAYAHRNDAAGKRDPPRRGRAKPRPGRAAVACRRRLRIAGEAPGLGRIIEGRHAPVIWNHGSLAVVGRVRLSRDQKYLAGSGRSW